MESLKGLGAFPANFHDILKKRGQRKEKKEAVLKGPFARKGHPGKAQGKGLDGKERFQNDPTN